MNRRRLSIVVLLTAAVLSGNAALAQPANPANPPPEPRAVSAEELAATVEAVASNLREQYVFPDLADRMAADVLARLQRGEYASVENERALAERLTTDLRAVSNDKHLRVVFAPQNPESAAGPMRRPGVEFMRRDNYSFRKVEVLEGNIGYLRFDLFHGHEEAKEAAAAALAFLAHADALVIDLRHNGGGDPDMIRFISSYFFEEPTLLNSMLDRNGEVVSEYWTLQSVPGKRFAADLPIFVLTSSSTFSGAEEFSYNLQNLQRAVIIGETTGGGAHPTRRERVNDRFVLGIPYLRAHNPISKTNWEGTGVKPHIQTSAQEALDRAMQEAREAIATRRMAGKPAN